MVLGEEKKSQEENRPPDQTWARSLSKMGRTAGKM